MTRNSTLLPESESHDITVTWVFRDSWGRKGGGGGRKENRLNKNHRYHFPAERRSWLNGGGGGATLSSFSPTGVLKYGVRDG